MVSGYVLDSVLKKKFQLHVSILFSYIDIGIFWNYKIFLSKFESSVLVQSLFITMASDIFEFVSKRQNWFWSKEFKKNFYYGNIWWLVQCCVSNFINLKIPCNIINSTTIGPDKSWVVFFFQNRILYYTKYTHTHTHKLNVCHNVVMSVPPMNCTMKNLFTKILHIESYYINQKTPS